MYSIQREFQTFANIHPSINRGHVIALKLLSIYHALNAILLMHNGYNL